MEKGLFITIYGVNNLGKTTHCSLLEEKLNNLGFKVKRIKYPIYDIEPSGVYLNKILREKGFRSDISVEEFQLWYVINRYQFQDQLKKWLSKGNIVIAEDYSGTGIAWGIAQGGDEDYLISINDKLLKPDLAILFEGRRKTESIEKGHKHEENSVLLEKCRKVHNDLATNFGWERMQVEEKYEDTFDNLWKIVDKYLKDNKYVS